MSNFSFIRMMAVARKETLHIVRDSLSLGMALALPFLLLLLFGYALTLDVDNVPMVVWDQSMTPESRDLLNEFRGSRYFAVRGSVSNYEEIGRAIDRRDALGALVIPSDLAQRTSSGKSVDVQFIVDGSDANTATLASGYAEVLVRTYSQKLSFQAIARTTGQQLLPPLNVSPRVWFNNDMESKNFIVPGLIAVILMIIAALLTSLTVSREWETGTMEQLISTPVTGNELILGKLIPYFAIGLVDVAISVVMGRYGFDVPLRGNLLLLFTVAAIFLTGTLSMGILISIVTRNQLLSTQLAMVTTFLPAFLLSGFMFSISNMPKFLQMVCYLVPARYFIVAMRSIYLKGVGIEIIRLEMLLLAIFGVLMIVLANRVFKKRLA